MFRSSDSSAETTSKKALLVEFSFATTEDGSWNRALLANMDGGVSNVGENTP